MRCQACLLRTYLVSQCSETNNSFANNQIFEKKNYWEPHFFPFILSFSLTLLSSFSFLPVSSFRNKSTENKYKKKDKSKKIGTQQNWIINKQNRDAHAHSNVVRIGRCVDCQWMCVHTAEWNSKYRMTVFCFVLYFE